MSDDSRSTRARKPDRPKKPYPEFPLTPHASGAWQKKVNGRIYYFHKWGQRVNGKLVRVEGDGLPLALDLYKAQIDDIRAGRTPRARVVDGKVSTTDADAMTLGNLCNHFLTAKVRKRESGELGGRVFTEYKNVCDLLVETFGANRLVDDLSPEDFARLRAAMSRRWGPVRMKTETVRIKSVFKFGVENGQLDRPPRYGAEFKPPSASVLRRHRAQAGERMLEAEEVRRLLDAASVPLRAMALLGVNCGFGNTDCATLPLSALDLDRGWVNYPRPKTGVARRSPLWPETVAALRAAIAGRVKPEEFADCGAVFLTRFGRAWGKDGKTDAVKLEFGKLLRRLNLHRPGVGFYTLRHVFRTVADGARDPVAIDLIMGHADSSMGATYRERVDDARLVAVAETVRKWLWPDVK